MYLLVRPLGPANAFEITSQRIYSHQLQTSARVWEIHRIQLPVDPLSVFSQIVRLVFHPPDLAKRLRVGTRQIQLPADQPSVHRRRFSRIQSLPDPRSNYKIHHGDLDTAASRSRVYRRRRTAKNLLDYLELRRRPLYRGLVLRLVELRLLLRSRRCHDRQLS